MNRFLLCEYKRATVDGRVHIHARLKAVRSFGWSVVGVFQLTEDEWNELSEVCGQLGIAVTKDVEEPAISA